MEVCVCVCFQNLFGSLCLYLFICLNVIVCVFFCIFVFVYVWIVAEQTSINFVCNKLLILQLWTPLACIVNKIVWVDILFLNVIFSSSTHSFTQFIIWLVFYSLHWFLNLIDRVSNWNCFLFYWQRQFANTTIPLRLKYQNRLYLESQLHTPKHSTKLRDKMFKISTFWKSIEPETKYLLLFVICLLLLFFWKTYNNGKNVLWALSVLSFVVFDLCRLYLHLLFAFKCYCDEKSCAKLLHHKCSIAIWHFHLYSFILSQLLNTVQ